MSNKQLIHQGSHISLYKQRVELPDDRHTYYDVVAHPGGAVICAIDAQQRLCLITQPRPAVGNNVWEFPAGCLETGEPPLETAKRELEEEAGIVAKHWLDLGQIVTAPGFCDEQLYLFVATELTETATNFDEEEQIESHWLSIEAIETKISTGEINDAKTLSLLYKLKIHPDFSYLWRS